MNKISKKIVSLVTMAAFALTLVPAAAFAGTANVGDTNTAAQLTLDDKTFVRNNGSTTPATATVDVTVEKALNDNDSRVVIWVTDKNDKNVTSDGMLSPSGSLTADNLVYNSAQNYDAAYWLQGKTGTDLSADKYSFTLNLNQAGEYTLHALYWTGGVAFDAEKAQGEEVGTITVIDTDAVADDSRLLIDGKVGPAEATQNDEQEFTFNVRNGNSNVVNPLADSVYVWVEDSNNRAVSNVTFDAVENGTVDAEQVAGTPYWKVTGNVTNGSALTVKFANAGDGYSIHAGVSASDPGANTNPEQAFASVEELLPITVNVAAAEVKTTDIVIDSVTGVDQVIGNTTTDVYTATISDDVTPSDTKVYTVTGHAWVDTNVPAEGEKIAVKADDGLNLQGLDKDGNVTTDNTGKFTFKFTMEDAASYDIYLNETNGDASATLTVVQPDVNAASITKVSDGGYVLAGTDTTYASQVYGAGRTAYFGDAVQFAIKDVYGRDAVGNGPLKGEAAADTTNPAHDGAVRIINKGENSTLTAQDLVLAWDGSAYTLEYVNADGDSYASDLTPGEYSVRVALNNGGKNAVTVNFTVAEFGDVEDIVLDMKAEPVDSYAGNDNAITAIDDQVALGQKVTVTPKYVDANGLKVEIKNINKLQVGINGEAVQDVTRNPITFTTVANLAYNNELVGSTITVRVNDPATNKYVEKELTVVKNYLDETLSVDPVQGAVGEPNTVNVTIVDADNNISKVNGKLSASIVSQSDETADVTVKVNPDVTNGKASLYLESDKAGTADVRVVVTADNGELYATTFTYTFGDEDPYAGRTVVMTIGSADYIINNKVVEGDAAPYIDSAWRTMVPVRVLAESFGADVDYTDGVVTIVDGDTTIVMNVGEDTYTINDKEQTMDTAPVIGAGDRTYIPVRFVAEGLGYEVTPLYDVENGTTASVAFQK